MRKIIAVTGYVGSGKDTASDIISKEFPTLVKITFAKQLKEILGKVFDMDSSFFNHRMKKEMTLSDPIYLTPESIDSVCRLYGKEVEYQDIRPFIGRMAYTPRELMELFGTEILQSISKEIHVETEFRIAEKSDAYLVTDVRFMHEYNYLINNFNQVQLLYIDNSRAEANAKIRKSIAEKEISLLKAKSLIVDNNGTVDALKINIMTYVKGSI